MQIKFDHGRIVLYNQYMKNKKWLAGAAMTALGIILYVVSYISPQFAAWYAAWIYPVFKHTFGRLFSLFPFSVFEAFLILVCLGILLLFALLIRNIISKTKRQTLRKNFFKRFKQTVFVIFTFASYVLFVFMLNAGVNYNRESFADHAGIEVRDSSVEELIEMYLMLVERATILSEQIDTCADGLFYINLTDANTLSREAMRNLNNMYGGLGTFFPNAKAPMSSRLLMSNMRIGGFFSPWSMEPHFNRDMPLHNIPFTILHEQAHFAGHMRENEANFIAYLAGVHSGDAALMYSSVFRGLSYALNALFQVVTTEHYRELYSLQPLQVRRDREAARVYWRQFEGRLAEIQTQVNDAYLRANRQADGVRSYGRVVDLMLAYYRR